MDDITRMKDQVREEIMREFLCGPGTNEFRDRLDRILDDGLSDAFELGRVQGWRDGDA